MSYLHISGTIYNNLPDNPNMPEFTDIGISPSPDHYWDGTAWVMPDLAIKAKVKQITTIEAAYTVANEAPITYAGHTFQTDVGSIALMAQIASALPAGASISWWDSLNVEVLLTDAQFAELRGAILLRGQPLFAKRQTLKASIRAAITVAGVEAIVW